MRKAQIQDIGNKLLPMHLPILICGFVCGWKYGLLTGFITPLLRCMLFSMPTPLNAICMAFELATYGSISSIIYRRTRKCRFQILFSLLGAMIAGRFIWGLVSLLIYGMTQSQFTWQMFLGAAFINAIPGIVLQFILIPIIISGLEKAGVSNIED